MNAQTDLTIIILNAQWDIFSIHLHLHKLTLVHKDVSVSIIGAKISTEATDILTIKSNVKVANKKKTNTIKYKKKISKKRQNVEVKEVNAKTEENKENNNNETSYQILPKIKIEDCENGNTFSIKHFP